MTVLRQSKSTARNTTPRPEIESDSWNPETMGLLKVRKQCILSCLIIMLECLFHRILGQGFGLLIKSTVHYEITT